MSSLEEQLAAVDASIASASDFGALAALQQLRADIEEAIGIAGEQSEEGGEGIESKEEKEVGPSAASPSPGAAVVPLAARVPPARPCPPHLVIRDPLGNGDIDFERLAQFHLPLQPFLKRVTLPLHGRERKRQKRARAGTHRIGDQPSQLCSPTSRSNDPAPAEIDNTSRQYTTLDFRDSNAVRAFNTAILCERFGLKGLVLPQEALCPTVTLRANYIRWLQYLLDFLSANLLLRGSARPGGNAVWGIDVGTGCSCIYPLLGCAMNGQPSAIPEGKNAVMDSSTECNSAQLPWHFVATDIDSNSLAYARRNIELNGLQERIIAVLNTSGPSVLVEDVVFPTACLAESEEALATTDRRSTGALRSDSRLPAQFDFVMCNPPFFESDEQTKQNRESPIQHDAKAVELVTAGGEEEFIGGLIDESHRLSSRVVWYTSMLGRKQSFKRLLARLRASSGPQLIRTAEFVQGRTTRWGLAWSFCEVLRPFGSD